MRLFINQKVRNWSHIYIIFRDKLFGLYRNKKGSYVNKPLPKQEDIQLGLLIQDTLESYFEYEESVEPTDSERRNVKQKLEKLIKILKQNNDKYTSEFEALCDELSNWNTTARHIVTVITTNLP